LLKPTVWKTYKWDLIFGMSLFLLQAALIAGLLWQRARRRKAEAKMASALEVARESEGRFRLVANAAPVMIWMAGTGRLCTYVNQPRLEFTGRPLEAELGNGWAEGVHDEDLKGCLDDYTRAFDLREPFRMQYRIKWRDGEYRWLLDIGVPRFNQDGSFAGYIGSCLDITDRKQTEEALSGVSRRLIDAQEQERMRIARELHDDINQRIAMLGIKLDLFQQNLPNHGGEFQKRLNELRQLAARLPKKGQRAIEAASTLNPDLLVLDISMPILNGIQVASRRDLGCGAKLMFLTFHEDPDYIEAALSVGALGYVFKSRVATDPVPAMRSVLQGHRFMSVKWAPNILSG
jgi:PAS domain S-box-containing protein